MILTELTSVAAVDLPIAELKSHLRLGTGFAEDDLQDTLLETYLRASISAVEARAGRVLLTKLYGWNLTAWRTAARQVLPLRPVVSIDEVKLIDAGGVETVVAPSAYDFMADDVSPALIAVGGCLPAIARRGSVEISFEAGFGEVWSDVPASLAQAVLLVAAQSYEQRDGMGSALPQAALELIEPYRVVRLMRGT